MNKLGVYIHIPFCRQKCLYCDFTSFAGKDKWQKMYMNALIKELENWKKDDTEIKTVYIGGGTPSYIDSKYIVEILNSLNVKSLKDNEVTIEVNPGTITKQKLLDYRNSGVNRLSIGLQSTNNKLLKQIGRIHNYEQFVDTYMLARQIGFNNINVDLMIGLPNQSIKDIKETLESLINIKPCAPEHISVYSLIVEEETPIKALIDNKVLELPNEEIERHMYWYVKNYLELNGYIHYEISNFAKKGFESKHNVDCWKQKEYMGFGIAAHSYRNNIRFCNISNLSTYIENCENGEFNKNIIIEETQNKLDKMKEYMILGMRKIERNFNTGI